ncbi:MAG: diaminopimelate epimerase, partial [Lachnospiraceae bacterium]|nr:diaminopimelate epimerase [Lachnospiraceae bacterium]
EIPADLSDHTGETRTINGLTIAAFPDMGRGADDPACDIDYSAALVSMGNPHAVVVLPAGIDLNTFPLELIGNRFENHPVFPRRTNTEFVRIDNRQEVHMRVWERGTGETLACGTGCCAITVACALQGLTEDEITVHVLGGEVHCRYDRDRNTVWMTGPAAFVFDGSMEIP